MEKSEQLYYEGLSVDGLPRMSSQTHVALLVQLVVGQLQFVEVDDHGGPVGAQCG